MKLRAVGPYIFLKYHGTLGVMAKISSMNGKIYSVNAGNLLPVKDTFAERMVRFEAPAQSYEEDLESEITWSSDSDIDKLPEGVRVVPTVNALENFREENMKVKQK